jgi:hypothetical protein
VVVYRELPSARQPAPVPVIDSRALPGSELTRVNDRHQPSQHELPVCSERNFEVAVGRLVDSAQPNQRVGLSLVYSERNFDVGVVFWVFYVLG